MQHQVVVVGSANIDYSIRVGAFPTAGETRLGDSLDVQPGGKGLNQAVAAARLGATVHFVGTVGDDADGRTLIQTLAAEGVDTTRLAIDGAYRTGLAAIYVVPTGENSIVVVPGANSAIDPSRSVAALHAVGRPGDILVVQAEVPSDVVETGILAAADLGLRPVLNLAPYRPVPEHVLRLADPLVVNEVEAEALTGWAIDDPEAGLRAAAQLSRSSRSVVVTLGADGAGWARDGVSHHLVGPAVERVIDTTGAGDAFVGALAALLAEGHDLDRATGAATEAASISVTRAGAQGSYARRVEVSRLR